MPHHCDRLIRIEILPPLLVCQTGQRPLGILESPFSDQPPWRFGCKERNKSKRDWPNPLKVQLPFIWSSWESRNGPVGRMGSSIPNHLVSIVDPSGLQARVIGRYPSMRSPRWSGNCGISAQCTSQRHMQPTLGGPQARPQTHNSSSTSGRLGKTSAPFSHCKEWSTHSPRVLLPGSERQVTSPSSGRKSVGRRYKTCRPRRRA
jgi:hypothetical protein